MSEVNTHLERLKRVASSPAEHPVGIDAEDESTAFSAGRVGTNPQLTLVLRKANGNCHAFSYAHLYSIEYDPSDGITLTFSQHQVRLCGRHLDDLFRYLCHHRVQRVNETEESFLESPDEQQPVVSRIAIVSSKPSANQLNRN